MQEHIEVGTGIHPINQVWQECVLTIALDNISLPLYGIGNHIFTVG